MRVRPIAAAGAAVVVGAVAGVASFGAPSSHADRPADALADRATGLADRVVARYAAIQRPDGSFPDPVVSGSDYGTAMLGLAMVQRGERHRDGRLLSAGTAALRQAADEPTFGVFELVALARAYRFGERSLLGDPVAAGAWAGVRGAVGTALSTRSAITGNPAVLACFRRASCYSNQKLVAALAARALLDTPLRSAGRQALLGDRDALQARVDQVAGQVPAEVGTDVKGPDIEGPAGVLSDPPRNPLAYHALSVMLLGELTAALGDDAPVALHDALRRADRTLLAFASPDGDLSYYGRGQGQVWVPAVTVAAASQAALRATDAAQRGAALSVASRAMDRLVHRHRVGRYGLQVVPGAGNRTTIRSRGLDDYASTRSYNGLAVAALDAAATALHRIEDPAAAPDVTDGATVGGDRLPLAVLRSGSRWAAISTEGRNAADARYGPGLLALRVRASRWPDLWVDAVPAPAHPAPAGSTIAFVDAGRRYVPRGSRSQVKGASVLSTGRWVDPASGGSLPGTARWRWELAARGLQVRFRAPCTCLAEVTVRMEGGATAELRDGQVQVASGARRAEWSLRSTGMTSLRLGPARRVGASAYVPRVAERRLTASVRAGAVVAVTVDGGVLGPD